MGKEQSAMTLDKPVEVLLSDAEIQARVRQLGAELTRDYAGRKVIILGVLKGSFVFMADLVRAIDLPLSVEFLGLSSYGGGTHTSGEVKVTLDLNHPINGQHVIVAEDIIDTGVTLSYLLRMLSNRQPASLKLCCLLNKEERRQANITPDYVGFTIPNRFVVGYGLDYDEYYRNLPYIGVLDPEDLPDT